MRKRKAASRTWLHYEGPQEHKNDFRQVLDGAMSVEDDCTTCETCCMWMAENCNPSLLRVSIDPARTSIRRQARCGIQSYVGELSAHVVYHYRSMRIDPAVPGGVVKLSGCTAVLLGVSMYHTCLQVPGQKRKRNCLI